METRAALSLSDLAMVPTQVAGVVAKQRASLAAAQVPVAASLVVPSTTFQAVTHSPDLITQLRANLETTHWDDHRHLQTQARAAQALLRSAHWPPAIVKDLSQAYHQLGSQTLVELQPAWSTAAADQPPETHRWVSGDANLVESLLAVWIQSWTEQRLLQYYQTLLTHQLPALPWLVVAHPPAEAAGVAFTRHPYTHAKTILIYAVRGEYEETRLANAYASFEVDIRTRVIVKRHLASQPQIWKIDEKGWHSRPNPHQNQPPLSDEAVIELAVQLQTLKQTQFEHQQVSWARHGQTWAIHSLQPLPEPQFENHSATTRKAAIGQTIVPGQVQAQVQRFQPHQLNQPVLPGRIIILDQITPRDLPQLSQAGGLLLTRPITQAGILSQLKQLGLPCAVLTTTSSTQWLNGTTLVLRAQGPQAEIWLVQPEKLDHKSAQPPLPATKLVARCGTGLTLDESLVMHGAVWESKTQFIREGWDPRLVTTKQHGQRVKNAILQSAHHATPIARPHLTPWQTWLELSDWTALEVAQASQMTSSEVPGRNPDFGVRGVARWQHQPWWLEWELELAQAWLEQQPRAGVILPGARTRHEIDWTLQQAQLQLPDHGRKIAWWIKVSYPQLLIELLTGEPLPVAGYIFDTASLHAHLLGLDPSQPDLISAYQAELAPTQHLIANTWSYLKQCQPQGSAATAQTWPWYLEIAHHDHRWIEWGLDLGVTGFMARPELVTPLKTSIMESEAQLIHRRYASHQ